MSKFFENRTNQLWDNAIIKILIISFVILYIGLINKSENVVGILLAILPIALLSFVLLFTSPRVILITLFYYNFFSMGLTRYIPGQLGLGVDGLLVLTYIRLIFKSYNQNVGFSRALNSLTLMAIAWFFYAIFELMNPIAESREAWVYAVRGVSLYFILTVPLVFIVLNKYKDLNHIIFLWGVFSILGVLKGIQQLYIGMDYAEQAWLDQGGALTHIIWSGLRVFSFFTDAGQFGAAMGHSGVMFAIMSLGQKNKRMKIFCWVVALMSFYGMGISGTRGAMAVPAMGGLVFLLLSKNWKLFAAGIIFLAFVFVFFNYTMIGNGNAQIRRMRSSFNSNDASLQTRLNNQAKLKVYLVNKPFGCGIGSAGTWGMRFSPWTVAAQTPTDSWFVAIWVEQGVVGLTIHLAMIFFFFARGSWLIMTKIRDKELYYKLCGLMAGYMGIVAASYGNTVYGQFPTGIILYMSLAFIFMGPQFQKEIEENSSQMEFIKK